MKKYIITGVTVLLLISGLIAYLIWRFPQVYVDQYNWGKTICVIAKPESSWSSDITCKKQ